MDIASLVLWAVIIFGLIALLTNITNIKNIGESIQEVSKRNRTRGSYFSSAIMYVSVAGLGILIYEGVALAIHTVALSVLAGDSLYRGIKEKNK